MFATSESTSRFLSQATFGPSMADINATVGSSASEWIRDEFAKPATLNLDFVLSELSEPDAREGDDITFEAKQTPTFSFWINAIEADDQLRQRTAFALSQILVISHVEGNLLFEFPSTVAHYQDILVSNAFGNYRDILDEVTYSPAMAFYLTYFQNQKADPDSGQMPDENYAREIMQLFTIGLVELQPNGEPVTDASGQAIETYDNDDVTGLARVFTGLSLDSDEFFVDFRFIDPAALYSRLKTFPEFHSEQSKTFLDTTIPAGTGPEESIDTALDTLFNHPNLPPFLARQLIQRFVTSDPNSDYVDRVATAFATGSYQLPDESVVGEGVRGDMQATIAAVLFDEEARSDAATSANDFGKVREPVIRFVHWARAFNAGTVTPENTFSLWNTSQPQALAQGPYKSPSVFNFYRPGYIAPGTESGAAGLTVPELQLVNASTVAGYANFMTFFVFALAAQFEEGAKATSFIPDYSAEIPLADDPAALVDHLDTMLTFGAMTDATKTSIIETLENIPLENPDDPDADNRFLRVGLAVLMTMTAPDYVVQR
ncbi:MAG: DUF1800 family protein [Pseudomonadota bacterium]